MSENIIGLPVPAVVGETGEVLPVASYQEYEAFCNDGNTSSRKCGILDEGLYHDALADSRTVAVAIGGKLMPAIVAIEHGLGLGYEVARAEEYAADQPNISALAVPITHIDEDAQSAILGAVANYTGGLYFSDHNQEDISTLFNAMGAAGRHFEERPLLDGDAGNTQAALSLFICDSTNIQSNVTERSTLTLKDIQAVFDNEVRPNISDPANAAYLENGANLTQEQLSQIWDLYHQRFQDLGENHPISMEDDEESFLRVLQKPDTTVALLYEEGKITCLTDITESFDELYWLNRNYLDASKNTAPGMNNIFFPGIVATKETQTKGKSLQVIGLFARMAAKAGMSARVIFENTNRSERYIPRIVQTVIARNSEFDVHEPVKVDEVNYRLALIS